MYKVFPFYDFKSSRIALKKWPHGGVLCKGCY